jgi:hypothetical protein
VGAWIENMRVQSHSVVGKFADVEESAGLAFQGSCLFCALATAYSNRYALMQPSQALGIDVEAIIALLCNYVAVAFTICER